MKRIHSNLHEITPDFFEKHVDMGLGEGISFKFTNNEDIYLMTLQPTL